MTSRPAQVVMTGVANMASIRAGLQRAGLSSELSADAAAIRQAERVVLPGVGAFAAGMQRLRDAGLVEVLRQRIVEGRPMLVICLGLQLLCRGSEESPGVEGLGVVDAVAKRFPGHVRVPQLGWNQVVPAKDCRLLRGGYAYFANSYRVPDPPAGWSFAMSHHGGSFVSALERGSVLACQFHPELSTSWGHELLSRWIKATAPC